MTGGNKAYDEIRSGSNYLLARLKNAQDFSNVAELMVPQVAAEYWLPDTKKAVAWALLDEKFAQQGAAFVKEALLQGSDDPNLTQAQQQAEAGNWEAVKALRAEHSRQRPAGAARGPYAASSYGYR